MWMVWTEGLQHLVPSILVPAHTWMALEDALLSHRCGHTACMWAQVASGLGPIHMSPGMTGASSPGQTPLVSSCCG